MIKKLSISFAIILWLWSLGVNAQIVYVSTGTDLYISPNTIFYADGLTLTPSSGITLSGANSISRNSTLTSPPGPTYTSRVYLFNSNVAGYSGTIQINYLDGELNGLDENSLQVNNYNGSTWTNYTSSTNDPTGNYALSSSVSNITLKEITLAALAAPLPVTWLSFNAAVEKDNVNLQWSTSQETNSSYFEIFHKTNASNWESIHKQKAAGNSTTTRHYEYWHLNPVLGYNYYQIIQTDYDNSKSNSAVEAVNTMMKREHAILIGNPVMDKVLKVQLDERSQLALYSMEGKEIWQKQFDKGVQTMDVNDLQKGIYFLKTQNQTLRLLIL